jgi:hypothetical protein
MRNIINAHKILLRETEGKGLLGRSGRKLEDNIKNENGRGWNGYVCLEVGKSEWFC